MCTSMTQAHGRSCATCFWWVPESCSYGECRRHAPTSGGFSVTDELCWCGDYCPGDFTVRGDQDDDGGPEPDVKDTPGTTDHPAVVLKKLLEEAQAWPRQDETRRIFLGGSMPTEPGMKEFINGFGTPADNLQAFWESDQPIHMYTRGHLGGPV